MPTESQARRPRRAAVLVCRRALAWLLAAGLAVGGAVQAQTWRAGGTGAALGALAQLAEAYHAQESAFRLEIVRSLGSAGGIKALLAGGVQVAVIGRPLTDAERSAGIRSFELGRSAFVLATAKPGVEGLTLAELADYYAGRKTTWPDGQPVRLVLRPRTDADTGLLAALSPAVGEAVSAAAAREGMIVAATDQDAADAIERLPGALGTATAALIVSEGRRIRPLAIDGVAPTAANLASGRYPYAKTFHLAWTDGSSPAVRKFLDFVRSEAGRKVLARSGVVTGG